MECFPPMKAQSRRSLAAIPYRLASCIAVALSCASLPALAGQALLSSVGNDTPVERLVVKYRDDSAQFRSVAQARQAVAAMTRAKAAGDGVELRHERRMGVGADVVRLSRKLDRVQAQALIRQLATDPNVEYVRADVTLQAVGAGTAAPVRASTSASASATPNDPRYSEVWGLYESIGGINAPAAWARSTGSGTVVAVLDTGIIQHPDLNANVLPGYDFITDAAKAGDGDGRDASAADPGDYVTDSTGKLSPSSWHGSHVAGTIAAMANNAVGITGVAYNTKILPVRVLGRGGGSSIDIADAIVWASGGTVPGVPTNPHPAEVINLSLGGPNSTCFSDMQAAINRAVMRGTTVVIASGNANIDVAGFFPANCNNVVAVAANDREGNRTYYSNFGAKIDVTAPGGETRDAKPNGILSTVDTGLQGPEGPGYAFYPGTSMAAPHVAGVVAMMQAVAPSPRTPEQIEALLKQSARKLPGECSGGCGAGIIDAAKAVELATQDADNAAPVAGFTANISNMSVTFTDSSRDSDGTIVSRTWDFGDGTSSTETHPVKSYLRDGEYSVLLRVIDNRGGTSTKRQTISIGTPGGTPLLNGTPLTNIDGVSESYRTYRVDVPAGASNLVIKTTGGRGDVELLHKFGAVPTLAAFDCRPKKLGNEEQCALPTPQAGTHYVVLYGIIGYSGVTLSATWQGGVANKPPVANFQVATEGLKASFTDASSDPDGNIAKRVWEFGDGTQSTEANPVKTYAARGTYSVKLTVTDNQGATAEKVGTVTVDIAAPDGLQPGKPVTSLTGAKGSEQFFTMTVPAGARGLSFATSGGTGDADLFVKFGSKPTDSSYDCRSQGISNAERCAISNLQPGTYHVRVKGYQAYSGLSLVGDYSTGGGVQTYRNDTDVTIVDSQTVESPIAVSGRDGKGLSSTEVAVDILHSYIGDLKVELVAPSGTAYALHNRSGGSADNIRRTYTVDLSNEALNGNWKLRVYDAARGDTGKIDQWSVIF